MDETNERAGGVSEERLKEAQKYIEEEEGVTRRLSGWKQQAVTYFAVVMSLYHLYAAVATITTQVLRGVHVAMVLFLSFLVFPPTKGKRGSIAWYDVCLALIGVATIVYMLVDFEGFIYRAVTPDPWDLVFGAVLIILILESTRRSTGWIMPIVVIAFLLYAYFGPYLPAPWTHRGYTLKRIIGHMYMTLEGIFGVPIDVSSTFIILFTIYGAILDHSKAGKFFIDFSFRLMGGKPSSAGRTVTMASFLLGGPSGSGVATTVTLGSVAYPMLKKAGYDKESAGGLLSAGGIGAIISPPVLGAAAFLIAEILKVSYLQVIKMALVPTILYYWSIFLMVEFDAKRFGAKRIEASEGESVWTLTRTYWYHFSSLVGIVVLMIIGFSPIWAVFWATVLAYGASFLRRDTALYYKKTIAALSGGSLGVLSVATTCASAGIIVGVVTLTGLGLKFSSIIISYAHGNLFLTAVLTGVLMWVIGLAVPVTATYIIGAVIAAPALIQLKVPDFAAHMFIFYYAVLSEVSPPTALSPFAAAALTGGSPFRTMMMAWKYTIPAFIVPFMFVLTPDGMGLLLEGPPANMVWTLVTALIGVFGIAAGASSWLFRHTAPWERTAMILGGLLLVYSSVVFDIIGFCLIAAVVIWQKMTMKREAVVAGG
ncbi:MAG: DctM-like transporter [Syntrophorhabdaceae bacterium PtaU1.Bin034]|nr:MAG: DctM-like transporter [Syntrophorhabdaceae bacterium PtaU1.Bin034]